MARPTKTTFIGNGIDLAAEKPLRTDRLLALEIRSRRLGFVILEGPTKLLDWGVRRCPSRSADRRAAFEKRIRVLLELYNPTAVVMRRRISLSPKAKKEILSAEQVVRSEANNSSTTIESLSTRKIRRFFADHGCATKHQIASFLAKSFEELSWKLPPKRKPWQSEPYVTVVFDAAATGVVFLDQQDSRKRESIFAPSPS